MREPCPCPTHEKEKELREMWIRETEEKGIVLDSHLDNCPLCTKVMDSYDGPGFPEFKLRGGLCPKGKKLVDAYLEELQDA